jgi:hypothetical protein
LWGWNQIILSEDSKDSGKTSKFQPKVLGRVFEKMKEKNAAKIVGKGVKTLVVGNFQQVVCNKTLISLTCNFSKKCNVGRFFVEI